MAKWFLHTLQEIFHLADSKTIIFRCLNQCENYKQVFFVQLIMLLQIMRNITQTILYLTILPSLRGFTSEQIILPTLRGFTPECITLGSLMNYKQVYTRIISKTNINLVISIPKRCEILKHEAFCFLVKVKWDILSILYVNKAITLQLTGLFTSSLSLSLSHSLVSTDSCLVRNLDFL